MKLYKEVLHEAQQNNHTVIETVFRHADKSRIEILGKRVTGEKGVTRPSYEKGEDKYSLFEPVASRERLIILGGGHVALPLSEFAARLGFAVTIVDDRPEFSNTVRFPWAQVTICDSFMNALQELRVNSRDYIAVLTRGHRHDAECLRQMLEGPEPYYLGMIGSRRRVRGLFDMLEEEGYPRSAMNRICTPIGLDIGAVLPEEIAVSVLAELVQRRRKGDGSGRINGCMTDLDFEVIKYLAETEEPCAVVTVMETKGSVPRGAGAKMVVDRYARIHGSIGGGCAEKAVIDQAVRMIGRQDGGVVTVDMTGDVAESEGMVCGGVMTVLIETYACGPKFADREKR